MMPGTRKEGLHAGMTLLGADYGWVEQRLRAASGVAVGVIHAVCLGAHVLSLGLPVRFFRELPLACVC